MKSKLPIAIIFLIIAYAAHFLYSTTYSNFELKSSIENKAISLPHSGKFNSKENIEFIIEGNVSLGPLSSHTFHITPDDKVKSIWINDEAVDLTHIPEHKLSSWDKGFKINLSKYLTKSKNHIKLKLVDTGGRYGIFINNTVSDLSQVPYWLILSICIAVISFIFAKFLKLREELCIALVVGILLRWFYVLITGFDPRGHDTWEHIEYIIHFTESWTLPDLTAAVDGAYFHPPLYYWFSSIIFEVSQWASSSDKEIGYKWLQYLSFFYSVGFLAFSAKLIDLFFQEIHTQNPHFRSRLLPQKFLSFSSPRLHSFFAMICLSVWPSAVLHSSRIGNDPQLYFLFIAASYYIYKFYLTPKFNTFLLGSVFTAMAVTTKANAAVLGLAGAAAIIYHWIKMEYKLPKKAILTGILPCLLLVGSAALTFYPGIALKLSGDRTHLYIDNINNVSSGLQVGNEVRNYLWIDIKTFITPM